jgi:hypothetical protein
MSFLDMQVEEILGWMSRNEGLGAITPVNRRLANTVMSRVRNRVIALGGRVGSKSAPGLDGKMTSYTVFDLGGTRPYTVTTSRNTLITVTSDETRHAASEMWKYYEFFTSNQGSTKY